MVKQQASRKDKMKQSRTLDCEDDVRDLSIILTDKILNKFDRTTPDETTVFDPDEFPCKYGFKGAIIPLNKNYSLQIISVIKSCKSKE